MVLRLSCFVARGIFPDAMESGGTLTGESLEGEERADSQWWLPWFTGKAIGVSLYLHAACISRLETIIWMKFLQLSAPGSQHLALDAKAPGKEGPGGYQAP